MAANGSRSSDELWLQFTRNYPKRFVPFGGQGGLAGFYRTYGQAFWTVQASEMASYLLRLEAELQSGGVKGIGELYVNKPSTGEHYPADSAIMKRLWALSATYQIPLSVHMDDINASGQDSVTEMESLLASDRKGIWIWAHSGHTNPSVLRPLLQKHPNLYIELSARLTIYGSFYPGTDPFPVEENGILKPAWKELLQEFPDRFVIGTDVPHASIDEYSRAILLWRKVLHQLPLETEQLIAFKNAERLLKISILQQ